MKKNLYVSIVILLTISCKSQSNKCINPIVGGPCEGCEAIFEYGTKKLSSIDTLTDFLCTDQKINLTGVVYENDGKTPAENVILYIYHTNRNGLYETNGTEEGWGKRHGKFRGWVKTDSDGRYSFYTFRPASYPNSSEPAHIHITVKEPDYNEYYIDEFVFDNDSLLTVLKQSKMNNRGGSGVVSETVKNGILTMERNIILGLNIPNYE